MDAFPIVFPWMRESPKVFDLDLFEIVLFEIVLFDISLFDISLFDKVLLDKDIWQKISDTDFFAIYCIKIFYDSVVFRIV